MPSVKVLEMKQGIVSEIKDKLNSSKSFVLFEFVGDNKSFVLVIVS